MPSGTASIASFWRSLTRASVSPLAWPDVDEQTSRSREPRALHISSMAFATSTLLAWRCPESPSKSRSTWKPVTRRPLCRTAAAAAGSPSGWPTMSEAFSMTWVNPAARTARSFGSSGPAMVIVSMPK